MMSMSFMALARIWNSRKETGIVENYSVTSVVTLRSTVEISLEGTAHFSEIMGQTVVHKSGQEEDWR